MNKLLAILAVLLILTGCGGGSKSASNDDSTAQDKQEETATEMSEADIYDKLSEIKNWYTGDIWNDGLCQMSWYVKNGTSAFGDDLDIEMTLKQYNDAIKNLEAYNSFVTSLSDPKYDDVKFAWEKLYNGIKEADAVVQSNEITANSNLDLKTDKLTQYSDAFGDYIEAIKPEK